MSTPHEVVMIVDDDALVRATCRAHLEDKGYSVLEAATGELARPQIVARRVDAVFLDILMPDKDGLQTLLEIKKKKPGLRVFAMSGGGPKRRYDFLQIATKFGADGTLRKPFSPAELAGLLRRDT